ncbi:MAG TPA: hypothetical protein DCW68_01875 [Rhodospirillaceae bacterium]|nr:MAG: hypothetical protein A2018_04840 [Alphaproteobacteria bacterium GWF2_58_20]HAU28844.1 hypothetical protein [Rhodospirillaceae bacterium]
METQLQQALSRVHNLMHEDESIKALNMLENDAGLTAFAVRSNFLLTAAEKGCINIAQHLLENGADINCRDEHGNTPLHQAAWNRKPKMAKFLILHGAKINAVTENWYTPLHHAAFQQNPAIVQMLIYHGACQSIRAKVTGHLAKDEAPMGSDIRVSMEGAYATWMHNQWPFPSPNRPA